jgi:hypothetical protein
MALAGTDGEAVSRDDAATVDDDAGGGWATRRRSRRGRWLELGEGGIGMVTGGNRCGRDGQRTRRSCTVCRGHGFDGGSSGFDGSGLVCSWWRSTSAAASRLGGAGVLNGGRDAGEAGIL